MEQCDFTPVLEREIHSAEVGAQSETTQEVDSFL